MVIFKICVAFIAIVIVLLVVAIIVMAIQLFIFGPYHED